jgi:diadenosine tetraphosphate (Ap4A) HIT family hydrolase
MANLIEEQVQLAHLGENPHVIIRMRSGWAVIGMVQPLPGYCLLMADPVVESLNSLNESERIQYSLDVIAIGDALLKVTAAYRINYETLGNSEPALHTHIVPRYRSEPIEKRQLPPFMAYDWESSRKFDPAVDQALVGHLRTFLQAIPG